MLTALVLICSVAVTPDLRDCTRYNATAVMRLPAEFANPATCFIGAGLPGWDLHRTRARRQRPGQDRLRAQRNGRRVHPAADDRIAWASACQEPRVHLTRLFLRPTSRAA